MGAENVISVGICLGRAGLTCLSGSDRAVTNCPVREAREDTRCVSPGPSFF